MIPDTISREIEIDAPPEVVWTIVTEPLHLAGWLSDEAEIELRPGGEMVLSWNEYGSYRGRVETVDPPHVFAFRWMLRDGVELGPGSSTLVVFTLSPRGAGTLLQVTESGFSELSWGERERADYHEQNTQGWGRELGELSAYASQVLGAPPRPE